MIYSIKTVNSSFYKVFTDNPITIMYKNSNVPVRVIFADRFNETPAEVLKERYPAIAIQSYTPRPSREWKDNQSEYVDGFEDYDEETGTFDTGHIYREPILLDFTYDVSIAAKTRGQYDELMEYMFKRFGIEGSLLMDQVILPDGVKSGYPVWYTCQGTDIPRSDEVKETNYEFKFNCFVDLKDPIEAELVNKLNITLNGE